MASTPEAEEIIFAVMYVITMLVSLIGNTLLIYIVWKKPEVRSLTSFMFVNMAVTDLLVTLVVIPYTISNFYTKGVWPMGGAIGEVTCKAVIFTAFFTITTTILCLTFMAVDKYYAVVHPFRRLLWFRRPKVLTPLVWIMSMVLMSIVPVYVGLFHENSSIKCRSDFTKLGDKVRAFRGVNVYFFVVNYIFPVSIISILYTITGRKLWFHKTPGDDLGRRREQQEIAKKRVVRMLIIVFTVFSLCWLPGQVLQLYLAITGENKLHQAVWVACFWFGHSNSAINPWLYISLNTKINNAFRKMIKFEPSQGSHNRKAEDKEPCKAIKETSI